MATYAGSSLALVWTTSTGTTNLEGDFRTLTINENIDTIDATAGADAEKKYIAGPTDRNMSLTYLHQEGTADIAELQSGQVGTLTVYPEGTASTKPTYTIPALISQGASWNIAYNAAVEITVGWLNYGDMVIGTVA